MKTVIILGNARSGTSMISGIVHQLGVNMRPKDNPSIQNPKGSFEDHDFIQWTSTICQSLIDGDYEKADEATQLMNEGIQWRMEQGEDWGFKSALTHRILHRFDFSLFDEVYFIINYRNDLHNAKSWLFHLKENYNDTSRSLEDALEEISKGNRNLSLVASKLEGQNKYYTCYEDVKDDPLRVAEEIAEFLGIEFTDDLRQTVDDFILRDYSTIKKEK